MSPEYFDNKPVELLVREGTKATDLNDECLGHTLDQLFKQGVTEIFAAVSARALQVLGIETQGVHLNSSSFGLHGAYESDESQETDHPIPIQITHRYPLRRIFCYHRQKYQPIKQRMSGAAF